ncbi:MAG: cupin domain-containing protein [Bdellovibrionales bacterium]
MPGKNSFTSDPLYRLSASRFLGRRPVSQYDPLHFVLPDTDWSDIFSLNDFEHLLYNQRLGPEDVIFLEKGVRQPVQATRESYFQKQEGKYLCNKKLVQVYLSKSVGLKLPFVDKHFVKLNEFKKALARKVKCPITINAYYSPKDSAPFLPVHRDPYDIFIIQVSGTKRFHCGKVCQKEDITTEQYILNAGDTFFLPDDVPHWAEALNSDSLHLTIGMHKITTDKYIEFLLSQHQPQTFSQNQNGVTDFSSNEKLLTELSEINKSEQKFNEFLEFIINS